MAAVVGALTLGVPAGAQGPDPDPDPGRGPVCSTDPSLGPPIPVAVVHHPSAGIDLDRLEDGLEDRPQLSVRTRLVVEGATEPEPDGPAGGPPGSTEGWTEVAEDEVAEALVEEAGRDGIVVLVVGDAEATERLRRSTPVGIVVVPQPVSEPDLDKASTGLEALAAAGQRLLLGQVPPPGFPAQVAADVQATTGRWVVDLPGRPAVLEARIQSAVLTMPASPGSTSVELPCAGLVLPMVIEGTGIEDGTIDVQVLLADGALVSARAVLAADAGSGGPDADPGDAPPTDRDRDRDDDDDDDEERAGSQPVDTGTGGGGTVVPLLIGALLLGALVAAGLLLNRRSVVPAEATWPSPGSGSGPGPVPPGAREAAAAPSSLPPPTVADDSWTTAAAPGPPVALATGGVGAAPEGTGRRRWWVIETARGMHLACWVEKVDGQGEDAPPLVHVHSSGAVAVGVFDGTGGSGSAVARREVDGTERTGAWVASRLAREVATDWVTATLLDHPGDGSLADRLRSWFHHEDAAFAGERPVVRGSLHRVLPTTMAMVTVAPSGTGAVLDVLWAGDSRGYLLSPDRGLQVLTRDDTRESDALALIRDDQPMSNLISADRPFAVNHLRRQVPVPAVVLTATDGCFGYVATPAHFELLLLETMVAATSPRAWMEALVDRLDAVAADDASLAITCPGLRDFGALRRAVGPRLDGLRRVHGQPFTTATTHQAREQARERSWAIYRESYEMEMPEEVER